MSIKQQPPQLPDTEEIEEEQEEQEYQPSVPMLRTNRARQGNRNPSYQPKEPVIIPSRRFRMSKPLWTTLAGMLITLSLWIVFQQVVIPWWDGIQDQWHYGDGRITQLEANVGHGGMSHFLAQYYQGSIVVMEISPETPNNIHVYRLPALDPTATTPPTLTLTVEKINNRLDLVIQSEGSGAALILYNTGTAFSESEG